MKVLLRFAVFLFLVAAETDAGADRPRNWCDLPV